MAEEPSVVEDGHTIALKLVFIFAGLFVLVSFLSGLAFFQRFDNYADETGITESENENPKEPFSFGGMVASLFPGEKIALGQDIITIKDTAVRRAPASQIIGYQEAGSKGRVMEGPNNAFDREWWRIDFKETPDGWVLGSDINTNTKLFSVLNFFPGLLGVIKNILIALTILIIALFIFVRVRFNKINKKNQNKKEIKKQEHVILTKTQMKNVSGNDLPVNNLPIGQAPKTQETPVKNKKWENIKNLMSSHNSSDWRQGIIEADIILDDLLTKMGYQGNSIGDKLKQIEKSDFDTLDEAWSAHKIRNRIAHRGTEYRLEKNEAEKVIKDYEKVFKEFYYI